MQIIEVEQGTQDWLDLRRTKITATDVAVILGASPFKGAGRLWLEKRGEIEPDLPTEAMMWGNEHEGEARDALDLHLDFRRFEPFVCLADDGWRMASLDGMDNNELCEIKCPMYIDSKSHLLAEKGEVAEYYWMQIQHQLSVTGADRCHYWSWHPETGGYHVVVERDETFMAEYIEPIRRFYDSLQNSEDWQSVNEKAKLYANIRRKVDVLSADMKLLEQSLKNSGFMQFDEVSMTQVPDSYTYDYKAAWESLGLADCELEPYKKKRSGYTRISLRSEEGKARKRSREAA